MLGDASLAESGFVAVLLFLVLMAPLAPKLGQLVGSLFEKPRSKGGTLPN